MEFWPEFLASSWGSEFVAGGLGGMAGVISGYPLDTLRIRLQQPPSAPSARPVSAAGLLRNIVSSEGPAALYRGMAAPLASVTFQLHVGRRRHLVKEKEQRRAHWETRCGRRCCEGSGAGGIEGSRGGASGGDGAGGGDVDRDGGSGATALAAAARAVAAAARTSAALAARTAVALAAATRERGGEGRDLPRRP